MPFNGNYTTFHCNAQDLDLQRWKISGLPITAGFEGVHKLLSSLGWTVEEIIYQNSEPTVFTSSQKGKHVPAHFSYEGQPRAIKFKALNAAARQEAADQSMSSRQAVFRPYTRAHEQKQFMARVQAAAAKAPASPRTAAN